MDNINLNILLAVLIPIIILQLVLSIAGIASLVKKTAPKEQKIIWAIIILLVSTIGPIIYFAIGSNMLDNANTTENEGDYS